MRAPKVILFALGAVAVCLAAWLLLARRHSPVPAASITLVRYSPDTNVFVYPGSGKWLEARMNLKNEGKAGITFHVSNDESFSWATARTLYGSTNGYLAPHFMGELEVLRPGSNVIFSVYLPPDTLNWECGFSIATASERARAVSKISPIKVWRPLQRLYVWYLRSLPAEPGPIVQIKSGLFKISENVRASATNELPPSTSP